MTSSSNNFSEHEDIDNNLVSPLSSVGETPFSRSVEVTEEPELHLSPPSYTPCHVECSATTTNNVTNKTSVLGRLPWRLKQQSNGWKPVTLQAPFLGGFILVSVAVVVILELLSRVASRDGNGHGISFSADVNSLSQGVTFGFLYFPTILAVTYSLLWSWVDLDVKRLEPWFQMSSEQGAEAKDSLLLQYPFDFLPFIPVSAFRRKHWSVFVAGTIMLMVFWAITPLQSAIFNTGIVTRSVPSDMKTTAQLLPLEQQALDANFLNTAYDIAWVDQEPPPFSSIDHTSLPFEPVAQRADQLPTETWTTKTQTFSTSLSCTPANTATTPLGYTFDNGRGCSVSEMNFPATNKYVMNYIGYFDNAQSDWALQNSNCSIGFANNFLAILALGSSVSVESTGNLTALFCEPSYHIEEYLLTVNASNSAIVSAVPTGAPMDDGSVESHFNTTDFEYILGTGVLPETKNINLPNRSVLDQYARIQGYNLTTPVSNMVAFAVALNNLSIPDLFQPAVLQAAFERAHQLLFTTAFNSLLTPTNASAALLTVRAGTIQDRPGAIVLVRPVAIAVEIALAIVSILATVLWYHCFTRSSHLDRNPASIADAMTMIHEKRITPSDFESATDVNSVNSLTPEQKYTLLEKRKSPDRESTNSPDSSYSGIGPLRSALSQPRPETVPAVYPTELRLYCGLAFIFIIMLSIAFLIFLNYRSISHNGINLPSNNSTVLSILENYLPTVFATLLEPVWVILNRVLCLLKPFDELRKGNAKASSSINAKYSALPPPFVVWKAMRSGHLLLATVCIISLSSNLLAVSLSTLLNEQQTTVLWPTSAQRTLSPIFNKTNLFNSMGPSGVYSDPFIVMMSNVTNNTPLPPWLSKDTYFLPLTLENPPSISESISPATVQGFEVPTTGFGTNMTCNTLIPFLGNNGYQLNITNDELHANFTTTHMLPNGTLVTCRAKPRFLAQPNLDPIDLSEAADFPLGSLAMEVLQYMFPESGDDGGFCSSLIVVGYVRGSSILGNTTDSSNNTLAIFQGITSSSFFACTTTLNIAQYTAFVSSDGRILSTNQTTPLIQDRTNYFMGNASESDLFAQAATLLAAPRQGLFSWHNESFTSDWPNSILRNQNLVDPSVPAPDPEIMIPQFEKMYEQLFAILLALNAKSLFGTIGDGEEGLVEAKAVVVVDRIFVSPSMFKLSIIILGLHLIVAILYYSFRPKRFLSRMPTTIGVVLGYINGSRACGDFSDGGKGGEDMRYSFGRFWGTDGRTRVGVERAERVVLLGERGPVTENGGKGRTFSFARKGRSWSFGKRKEAGWI